MMICEYLLHRRMNMNGRSAVIVVVIGEAILMICQCAASFVCYR